MTPRTLLLIASLALASCSAPEPPGESAAAQDPAQAAAQARAQAVADSVLGAVRAHSTDGLRSQLAAAQLRQPPAPPAELAQLHTMLAQSLLADLGPYDEAESHAREAVSLQQASTPPDGGRLRRAMWSLADALVAQDKPLEAARALEQAALVDAQATPRARGTGQSKLAEAYRLALASPAPLSAAARKDLAGRRWRALETAAQWGAASRRDVAGGGTGLQCLLPRPAPSRRQQAQGRVLLTYRLDAAGLPRDIRPSSPDTDPALLEQATALLQGLQCASPSGAMPSQALQVPFEFR